MQTKWVIEHYASGGAMDNPIDLFAIMTEGGHKCVAVEVEAGDAALIAAVPEMLEALRMARGWFDGYSGIYTVGGIRRVVDEAIAKAEGREGVDIVKDRG